MLRLIGFVTVVFLIVSCCAGCAGSNYLQIGAGLTLGGDWQPGGVKQPTANFAIGRTNDDGTQYCEIAHDSNWFAGAPFNSTPETNVDRVECGFRIPFLNGNRK